MAPDRDGDEPADGAASIAVRVLGGLLAVALLVALATPFLGLFGFGSGVVLVRPLAPGTLRVSTPTLPVADPSPAEALRASVELVTGAPYRLGASYGRTGTFSGVEAWATDVVPADEPPDELDLDAVLEEFALHAVGAVESGRDEGLTAVVVQYAPPGGAAVTFELDTERRRFVAPGDGAR